MTKASFDCDDTMIWTLDNSWGKITDAFTNEELTRIREAQRVFFAWQTVITNRFEPPENPDAFQKQDLDEALDVLHLDPAPQHDPKTAHRRRSWVSPPALTIPGTWIDPWDGGDAA